MEARAQVAHFVAMAARLLPGVRMLDACTYTVRLVADSPSWTQLCRSHFVRFLMLNGILAAGGSYRLRSKFRADWTAQGVGRPGSQ